MIDTLFLEEAEETVTVNDIINIPLEMEEATPEETAEEHNLDNTENKKRVSVVEVPKFLEVTVTNEPELLEDIIRHVREPEPLKLKPRKDPEPDCKQKTGRLTQSVHMMMAYQSMYN